MDSFSGPDREALLKEIGQIKAALKPDENLKCLVNLYDESDFDDDDENLAGNSSDEIGGDSDEDYIPDFEGAAKCSPWYDQGFKNGDSSDDDDEEDNVITKTRSVFHSSRNNASTPSSFSYIPQTPATDVSVGKRSKESLKHDNITTQFADCTLDASLTSDLSLSSLECALQLNRDYQEIIKDELIKINCALKRNQQMQTEMENRGAIKQTGPLLARFRPTYFKDELGQGPPDNEDTKERKLMCGLDPFTKAPKLWTEKERQSLAEGVRNQNLERMTLQLKSELNELERQAKKNNTEVDKSVADDIKKRMAELRKIPKKELEENLEGLDFFNISKLYLPHRTEGECRIRWLVSDHPRINQSPWTREEDAELIAVARNHKNRNWELIAQELGTMRTPIQCFQRFQRSLNKLLLKRGWTDEENEELTRVIDMCPKKDWQQVANLVEGRAAMQILHHWKKTLKPGIKKGRWTKKENKLLLKYSKICGQGNWTEIAKHIPGRTDASVRDRWVNNYEPGLKKNEPWTKEEDDLLLKAVEWHEPGNWTRISKDVEGRTDNRCMNRWRRLRPDDYDKYQEKLKKKRELLSYFVGRNHERPNLDYDELKIPGVKSSRKRRKKKPKQRGSKSAKRRKELKISIKEDQPHSDEEQDQEIGDRDPDYELESDDSENTSDSEEDEEELNKDMDMDDGACNRFLESGNNLLLAFENGDAEYIDVKRELFLLKIKILKTTYSKARVKLQTMNDKQFEKMEEIQAKRTNSSERTNIPSDEEYSVPIRNKRLLRKPELCIEDTVFAPENIGIKSMRPVQTGHMPSNLAPFTLLLEAFHIDINSVMQSVNRQASSAQPSSSSATTNQDSSQVDKRPTAFRSIIPIAPNLVTLRAFRKLLLLRRRLVQLASLVPAGVTQTNAIDLVDSTSTEENSSESSSLVRGDDKNCSNNNSTNAAATDPVVQIDSSLSAKPKLSYQSSYEYQALSARFNGLFMWPVLLSAHVAREPVIRVRTKRQEQESSRSTRKGAGTKRSRGEELSDSSETTASDSDDYLSLDENDDYKPQIRKKKEEVVTKRITRSSVKAEVDQD